MEVEEWKVRGSMSQCSKTQYKSDGTVTRAVVPMQKYRLLTFLNSVIPKEVTAIVTVFTVDGM